MILILFAISAGILGSLLGLGGGIIMVPVLTLIYGLNLNEAVAISLFGVVVTSVAASYTFSKENLTNFRIGVLLQLPTVLGASLGAFLSHYILEGPLFIVFGIFLGLSAALMIRKRVEQQEMVSHPLAINLNLQTKDYGVQNPVGAVIAMFFAGVLSALLGIGAGSLKVLAMDNILKLPLKVSSATSNFMIGVTAVASSVVFLKNGKVLLNYTPPVILGIAIGASLGARFLTKIKTETLRRIFIVVLLFLAFQMIKRGL